MEKGLTRQALYVACSRARTLSGLYIEGRFVPPTCHKDDQIELEMQRLAERRVDLKVFENPKHFILHCLDSTDDTRRRRIEDVNDPVCVNKQSHINKKESTKSSFSLHPKQSVDLEVQDNPLITIICTISVFKVDLDSLQQKCWLTDAVSISFVMINIIQYIYLLYYPFVSLDC
jgi:hypothetical protein